MLELLQHLQFVVDHALIAADILLQDNLDCNLVAITRLRLPNNTVRACAERTAEFIESPERGIRCE